MGHEGSLDKLPVGLDKAIMAWWTSKPGQEAIDAWREIEKAYDKSVESLKNQIWFLAMVQDKQNGSLQDLYQG